MRPLEPDDQDSELSTGDSQGDAMSPGDRESDRELEVLLREVAHAPPKRPRSALEPGTQWSESGRYVIGRRLGRGGMGTVYAATDTILGRSVAIKVLDAAEPGHDASHDARLLREAQLAARVEHERVARVYDVGKHNEFMYVAMEYIPGGTLRQWMAGRQVPLPQVVDIATQIAEGLAELHTKGIVHRDLKPENVMLTAQGGIKLLDFGLARPALLAGGAPGSSVGAAVLDGASLAASGTPGYMAPEQYGHQSIDARADVFALGVILHELVTGERLFRGATVETIIRATLADAPVFAEATWSRIPDQLREHTRKMLARDPAARFADGGGVLAALRELTAGDALGPASLPAATAQPSGKLAEQHVRAVRWLARVPFTLTPAVELLVAVAAVALLIARGSSARAFRAPPPGMVRVDVGSLEVGRNIAELDAVCREMGSACDREQLERELPRTRVAVAPFFLDREEVTNQAFAEMLNYFESEMVVLDDEDHHYPRFVRRNAGTGGEEVLIDLNAKHGGIEFVRHQGFQVRAGREHLPAAQVSWYGAKLFCETHGKRLPSEDEWEAAARGAEDRRFPWGDDLPRCGAVVLTNDGQLPMPKDCPVVVAERAVGTSPQDETPDGIRDLGGNVAEWTSSRYVEGDRSAHPETGPLDMSRVIRGGSWGESFMARTSGRSRRPPSIMGANLGFRCASNVGDAGYKP